MAECRDAVGTTRQQLLDRRGEGHRQAAKFAAAGSAEDALNEFLPCVDYPIRVESAGAEGSYPIEIALSISEDGRGAVEGAPQMPAGARGAIDRAIGDAPTRSGMPARALPDWLL